MSVAELRKYTAVSKYAQWLSQEKRRELWPESVKRVCEMMVGRFPLWADEIRHLYEYVERQDVLGSQRAMQFGGSAVLRANPRLFNCTASYVDRLRFFQEAFYLLLCGSGVGFSVQDHHTRTLPDFTQERRAGRTLHRKTFVVPDTIEGWADAAGVLLSSYFHSPVFPDYQNANVEFDFSQVRPKGSRLSHGIGRAPGPGPLAVALEEIKSLLDRCLSGGQERLKNIDAYDLTMHLAGAVLAGGIRRSASISIFSPWDEEMAQAKTGTWFDTNPQRGRSNNSAAMLRNKTSFEEFLNAFRHARHFGEPGIYWVNDYDIMTNPCFRGTTRIATSQGLIQIRDLYEEGCKNTVLTDNRVGKGGSLQAKAKGVTWRNATPAFLTRKNVDIFRLTTEHGYAVEATVEHEFPTSHGRVKLKDLKVGDRLYLQSGEGGFGYEGNFAEGLLLGLIVGDGSVQDETAFVEIWEEDFAQAQLIQNLVNSVAGEQPSHGKRPCGNLNWRYIDRDVPALLIGGVSLYRFLESLTGGHPAAIKEDVPECVWRGSREMVAGYLQGFFFSDGTVNIAGKGTKQTISARFGQSNKKLLESVQILLQSFGIVSRLYHRQDGGERLLPDGKGGKKLYHCKDSYELVLSRPNCIKLLSSVGIFGRKRDILYSALGSRGWSCQKPERFITKVDSIEWVAREDVYCLTQPETNTVIANGCVVGQCVEASFYCRLKLYHAEGLAHHLLQSYSGPVLHDSDKILLSGWQKCNLTTINGETLETPEDFFERCQVASAIGTLQAAFTDFKYLGEVSEYITRREALLGVGISGMMSRPDITLDPDIQRKGAETVLRANELWASRIGINPTARATLVKPDGNSSCLLGSKPGIIAEHAKRYFRAVQANRMESPYQHFRSINPEACEPSVWGQDDDVIRFCCEAKEGSVLKDNLTALQQLENIRTTQNNWIRYGKVESRCVHTQTSHNVSNTVHVKDHEWEEVEKTIYEHRESYAGVSVLSDSGDRDYPQAPYTAVYTPEEIISMYGQAAYDHAPSLLDLCQKAGFRDLWDASSLVLGLWGADHQPSLAQSSWVIALEDYAQKFVVGDTKKATYALKDCANWSLWEKLKASYKAVDYASMTETEDTVEVRGESACAGGACLLN